MSKKKKQKKKGGAVFVFLFLKFVVCVFFLIFCCYCCCWVFIAIYYLLLLLIIKKRLPSKKTKTTALSKPLTPQPLHMLYMLHLVVPNIPKNVQHVIALPPPPLHAPERRVNAKLARVVLPGDPRRGHVNKLLVVLIDEIVVGFVRVVFNVLVKVVSALREEHENEYYEPVVKKANVSR